MAYSTQKIADIMQSIERRQIYLPAIQRKYVWDTDQITVLMDSIMRGYPFGTFLFWKVEKDVVNINKYLLYEFIREYDERDANNRQVSLPLNINRDDPDSSIIAVLDGQQRLTSLYIALKGNILIKKHKRGGDIYVKKELYLDLLNTTYVDDNLPDNEVENKNNASNVNGDTVAFDFLTDVEASAQNQSGNYLWYKVKDIMGYADYGALTQMLFTKGWTNPIVAKNIALLFQKIKEDKLINYFEVVGSSLDAVLDIFVRVNSAGTVLSKTDLLFSTVVAAWEQGREEFEELLKQVNGIGEHYKFTNDFLLRVCMYVVGLPTSLKVDLLSSVNVSKIANNWLDIKPAIIDTVYLLNELGFNGENIVSYNAIVPVVYYRYKIGSDAFQRTETKSEIRKYLVVAQLNHIFGRSTDSVLSSIRNELDSCIKNYSDSNEFKLEWLKELTFTGGTSLTCTRSTIEEWFDKFEKGPQTFMVLSLLYPDLKYAQVGFHQDHMHPYSAFDKKADLMKIVLPDGSKLDNVKIKEWRFKRNTLPNLQLLGGRDNQSKLSTPLMVWVKDPDNAAQVRFLPAVDLSLANFDEFLKERKKLMIDELVKILGIN